VQNKMVEFMNQYVLWKCTTSNSMIGAKDHLSIQMDMEEVNTMGKSDDSILQLAKVTALSQRIFDWRELWMWNALCALECVCVRERVCV
uniref:Uncharacterized protein n=1 Tax=Spermophilus dauricus TaxID=99837 RepID=A0A8C9QK63_SPEDA